MKKISKQIDPKNFIVSYKIDKEEQTIYIRHADGEVYLIPHNEDNLRRINDKMCRQAKHMHVEPTSRAREAYSTITNFATGYALYNFFAHRNDGNTAMLILVALLKTEDIISYLKYSNKQELQSKYKYLLRHKDYINEQIQKYRELVTSGLKKKAIREIESKLEDNETPITFNNVDLFSNDDLQKLSRNIEIEVHREKYASVKPRTRTPEQKN